MVAHNTLRRRQCKRDFSQFFFSLKLYDWSIYNKCFEEITLPLCSLNSVQRILTYHLITMLCALLGPRSPKTLIKHFSCQNLNSSERGRERLCVWEREIPRRINYMESWWYWLSGKGYQQAWCYSSTLYLSVSLPFTYALFGVSMYYLVKLGSWSSTNYTSFWSILLGKNGPEIFDMFFFFSVTICQGKCKFYIFYK